MLCGEKDITPILGNEILSFDTYIEQYKKVRFRVDYDNLMSYVRGLNKKLHAKKIPENNRAILFSGILLALEDETFYNSYTSYKSSSRLSDFLVDSIVQKLEHSNIHPTRIYEMQQAYNFIKTHTALIDEGYLLELVKEIHNEIRTFIKTNNYFDIISNAYVEFLKYANNDKKLGIVLTPPHITELFCDIASITKDSVVLDNCCGTSGFLVAAMQRMVSEAKGNKEKIFNIKTKQLIGIEYQDHIFTLGVSNMIIHGDGKTNIIKGDCFNRIADAAKYHPTVGFLNPPYNDTTGINELKFILNNLSAIEKNGCVVAIVPMSCALYQNGEGAELKRQLLENHTLEAVMSMPDDLFYPVGVVTCIMVFTAHVPHSTSKKKTWFGYWKDDGFTKSKQQGRIDYHGKWETIKARWVESFINREVHAGESVINYVSHQDEWCAEAYMETDYSKISLQDFEKVIKDYLAFKVNSLGGNNNDSIN
ncbi:HsdM family class I SAM-dependent methyltransferase [Yersinia enterocolitica]